MSAIGVDAIRVEFGDTVALDDVSLRVPQGEVTAVVGGDGAGKSTLLRVLAGRVGVSVGEVHSLDRARIGYQPSTSGVWGNLTVTENITFVGRSYGMSSNRIRSRGDELLDRAGLAAARDRLGSRLSGGMRQKLGFLLAILHEPDLILLDEPSTGVDPVSRVELWRLISETGVGDTAVLMATTYLDEAQRAASVTALDAGRVIAAGEPADIIANLPGAITRLDDTSVTAASWRRGTERHAWFPAGAPVQGAPVDVDLEDALIALTIGGRDTDEKGEAARAGGERQDVESGATQDEESLHPRRHARQVAAAGRVRERTDETPGSAPEVVAAGRGVVRRFGSHTAVDDVSLDVRAGEIVGLIGANGAGKTTFLRTLIGLDRPDDGEVELFGVAPNEQSRRRLGYVPQGLGLFQTISVAENATFFSRVYGTKGAELPPPLAAVAGDQVKAIGLGRQRQLAFALALAHQPDLLVLDEPTSGVDPLARARLWDIIHEQADAGRGVIVTTHYLQEAEQCTRLALMSHGRLLGSGSVGDLTAGVEAVQVTSDRWQDAFTALGDAGLPTMLSGRAIRVAGAAPNVVREALGSIPASVDEVAPTLEESMVLLEQ